MNQNTQNSTGQRPKTVRIAALIGVIVIAGLIIAAVVCAVLNFENSGKVVLGLITISFFLGVTIYLISLFSKLKKRKEEE
ncbi:MAG: hypothetical protein K6E95_06460 [Lachnospiraceae bacterium]|nr:hypothetical protein [Lachnospiraceae bacterium]